MAPRARGAGSPSRGCSLLKVLRSNRVMTLAQRVSPHPMGPLIPQLRAKARSGGRSTTKGAGDRSTSSNSRSDVGVGTQRRHGTAGEGSKGPEPLVARKSTAHPQGWVDGFLQRRQARSRGSTRMKAWVSCSRRSQDDRSEGAPARSLVPPHGGETVDDASTARSVQTKRKRAGEGSRRSRRGSLSWIGEGNTRGSNGSALVRVVRRRRRQRVAARLEPSLEGMATRSGHVHERHQTRLLPSQGEKRARRGSTNPS